MKTKLSKSVKCQLNFFSVIAIIIVITFTPTVIFHKDISLDRALFVSTWMELFGGGIMIALLFYYMTQIIEVRKSVHEDELNYNKIISIFTNTLKFFHQKKIANQKEVLFEYKRIPMLLNNIKDEKLETFINKRINDNYENIKNAIENLQPTTLSQGIETQLSNIITQLNLWKKNL